LPKFNDEKYGMIPEEFEVSRASEEDALEGIVTSACPFAFMID